MSQPNLNFTVRRADEGESVSGKIAAAAVRGLIVKQTFDSDGLPLLIPANGQRGFHLERDVVASDDASILAQQVFLKDFTRPDIAGTDVSARKCHEVEAEGTDLVQTSGTGAITADTAVDTAFGTVDGKYRVKQSGDELQGYLRGVIAAQGDGAFRIIVEEVG